MFINTSAANQSGKAGVSPWVDRALTTVHCSNRRHHMSRALLYWTRQAIRLGGAFSIVGVATPGAVGDCFLAGSQWFSVHSLNVLILYTCTSIGWCFLNNWYSLHSNYTTSYIQVCNCKFQDILLESVSFFICKLIALLFIYVHHTQVQ